MHFASETFFASCVFSYSFEYCLQKNCHIVCVSATKLWDYAVETILRAVNDSGAEESAAESDGDDDNGEVGSRGEEGDGAASQEEEGDGQGGEADGQGGEDSNDSTGSTPSVTAAAEVDLVEASIPCFHNVGDDDLAGIVNPDAFMGSSEEEDEAGVFKTPSRPAFSPRRTSPRLSPASSICEFFRVIFVCDNF